MLSTSARNFSRFRTFSKICSRFLSSDESNIPNIPGNEPSKSVTSSVDNDKLSDDVVAVSPSSTAGANATTTTTTTTLTAEPEVTKIGGFARSFEKIEKLSQEEQNVEPLSFASMIRQSKLMQIGEPTGRVILGTIFDVVEEDLYIDFGGKFHCVCKRPSFRASDYKQGVKVKLRLKDLEMTSKFLGSDKHVTLLEADAVLIGLHRPQGWTISENRPQTSVS